MAITRRQFLQGSLGSLAAAGLAPWFRRMPGTDVAYAAGPSDATVVFLQLFGGNDGVNTMYPLDTDQRTTYEEFRPTLQMPATSSGMSPWVNAGFKADSTVLDIGQNENGTTYAFHPAMEAFHELYMTDPNRLAILNGTHYPFPNHSHFRSMEIWNTLDPLGAGQQGWFGSYLNEAGFDATDLPGVMYGGGLSPIFLPNNTSLFGIGSLSSLVFPASGSSSERAAKQAAFEAMYAEAAQRGGTVFPLELVKIGETGASTIAHLEDFYLSGNGLENAGKVEALLLDSSGRYSSRNPLVYDSPLNASNIAGERLARNLRHVAANIRANIGVQFYHVGIGGFDSHSRQEVGMWHSRLLYQVSEIASAFYRDLDQAITLPSGYNDYRTERLSDKVLLVIFSEFGRTKRQNSTDPNQAGTDHAASAPMFVLGGQVNGGQHGAYPPLEVDGARKNDLLTTYDFRDVFGTILSRWLNVSAAAIGPGPGKILPATAEEDLPLNPAYTMFTPIDFLSA